MVRYFRICILIVSILLVAFIYCVQENRSVAIIVLGTSPLDENTPSLDMIRRVEAAVELLRSNPQAVIIFSGGITYGTVSEARMMADIAESKGVSPSQEILEEGSFSTIDNARLTAKIVKKLSLERSFLVSRPTHLKRAVSIFEKYSEFGRITAAPSRISKEEIISDLERYLSSHPSAHVRQIEGKVVREFSASQN